MIYQRVEDNAFHPVCEVALLRIKTKTGPAAFRIRARLAPGLLRRSFERAQPADFFEDTFGLEFVFKPL